MKETTLIKMQAERMSDQQLAEEQRRIDAALARPDCIARSRKRYTLRQALFRLEATKRERGEK